MTKKEKQRKEMKKSLFLTEKNRMLALLIMISIASSVTTGCSKQSPEVSDISDIRTVATDNERYPSGEHDDAGTIAAIYRDIYDEAAETKTADSLEVIRRIVDRLGENGYPAVDSENQIDMTCPEQIKRFCAQVDRKEEAEATLIVVISALHFVKYEFTTKDGNVEVRRSYCLGKGDAAETLSIENYPAYT